MHDFAGKVALVMGAACPPEIGRAVAVRLARAGADVACADRVDIGQPDSACASPEALDATVEAVRAEGRAALRLEVDVSDAAQVNEAVEQCAKELRRLDLVVNVVGVAPHLVRVNGVCPLGVDPDATDSGHSNLDQHHRRLRVRCGRCSLVARPQYEI